MVQVAVPTVEEVWKRISMPDAPSLMTTLGIISGEVLAYLETRGATTLHQLARELEWPARMTMMAVGALIRQGLIRAIQHDLEVIVEPAMVRRTAVSLVPEQAPEVWEG